MNTYDIAEAADFLKVDRTTVLELAGLGELPGAKVGRAWVFLESDLVDYLRDRVRRQTNERREAAALRSSRPDANRHTSTGRRIQSRRTLPQLPEVNGEIASAEVRIPT
jgi:excisionase family DNA binding protein